MKLKDYLTISKNTKNKQSIWNPKKRLLKKNDLTEEEILNMKIDSNLKEALK